MNAWGTKLLGFFNRQVFISVKQLVASLEGLRLQFNSTLIKCINILCKMGAGRLKAT